MDKKDHDYYEHVDTALGEGDYWSVLAPEVANGSL